MASLRSPPISCSIGTSTSTLFSSRLRSSTSIPSRRLRRRPIVASHVCVPAIDKSMLVVSETLSEDELWAAACLRVRTFNEFNASAYNIQDHRRYLAEREFEALKERVSGKREGFRRVSCINATLPLSQISIASDDLCSTCKFSDGNEDRVVVGSLDLNQCRWLPDEITGTKPEGFAADIGRAYLSNVCVAKELHRNGVGYELVNKSKKVAADWGITDITFILTWPPLKWMVG
ncbi:PREDICTED: uncharacterized protein LOC104811821 isoform X2 [Tarenaya hassleriana]|uniref:uncharacterized protein LOC104811821 isoform X2 n=1 Tax=Tarenaya hassleriana TaxID=28532 RepID=UPI00053C4BFD|nr:PREDICTED: uncharacterized protein LOC104811821 isoform X2 [Tarenaya hassleriana]